MHIDCLQYANVPENSVVITLAHGIRSRKSSVQVLSEIQQIKTQLLSGIDTNQQWDKTH